MPKLSDYWENFETYTGKASDVARQLSFAGIAVVWLLRVENGSRSTVPDALFPALALFVLSLSFDLLQYVAGSIIWGSFCRYHEKRLAKPEDNPKLTGPRWINIPTNFFFIGKIILTGVAYATLFWYCVAQL
jgi:hypothetical protein